jgi:hypothetical protein
MLMRRIVENAVGVSFIEWIQPFSISSEKKPKDKNKSFAV